MKPRPTPKESELSGPISAETLQLVFDSLLDIIWAVNEAGTIVYVSPSCCSILGYKQDELIGSNYLDLVHKDDRALTLKQEMQIVQSPVSRGFENRFIAKSGCIVYLFWSVKWDAERKLFFSVGRDITDRKTIEILKKKYEEGLVRSNHQITSILERITDAFFAVDSEWNVIYWNQQAEDMLGKRREEVVGENLWNCYPALRTTSFYRKYKQAITRNTPIQFEAFIEQTGTWAEINIHPSEDGHSIFLKDITERKEMQERLDLEAETRQKKITSAVIRTQERERAFIGKELHDNVNQVLTTVKLYNELAKDHDDQKEHLLNRCIQLLNTTIHDIRNLSKALSAPSIGNVMMAESVQELVRMWSDTCRLEFQLTIEVKEELINKDLHLGVYRILQEHITNVIKHAEAQSVQIVLISTADELHLQVIDDGKGFDTAVKSRGIGITNMKSRADNLNGILNIFSAPGKGSELNATFPITDIESVNGNIYQRKAV